MRYFVAVFCIFLLSGCFNVSTSNNFNESMTSMSSRSSVVHISLRDRTAPAFYFILESYNNDGNPKDILKVRWVTNKNYGKLFDGMNSRLKFIIDQDRVLILKPRSLPRRVSYDLDTKKTEEEAVFNITRSQLEELAYAKNVDVELNSKHKTFLGKFNRWHTFRAFKDFVRNT